MNGKSFFFFFKLLFISRKQYTRINQIKITFICVALRFMALQQAFRSLSILLVTKFEIVNDSNNSNSSAMNRQYSTSINIASICNVLFVLAIG